LICNVHQEFLQAHVKLLFNTCILCGIKKNINNSMIGLISRFTGLSPLTFFLLLGLIGAVLAGYLFIKNAFDELEALRVETAIVKQANQTLRMSIVLLTDRIEITERVVSNRDAELDLIREQLENATVDLGDDSGEPASQSLQELFRRL